MSAQTTYRCEFCDKTFSSPQALGGHATTHRSEAPPSRYSLIAEMEAARREVVARFRPRRRELEREIDKLQAQLLAKREELKELDAELRRLDPDATKPGPKGPRVPREEIKPSDEAKLNATRLFLSEHGDELGTFTVASLHRVMTERGAGSGASPGKMGDLLRLLQEEGTIRAHKITTGGGMSYAVVSSKADENGGDQ